MFHDLLHFLPHCGCWSLVSVAVVLGCVHGVVHIPLTNSPLSSPGPQPHTEGSPPRQAQLRKPARFLLGAKRFFRKICFCADCGNSAPNGDYFCASVTRVASLNFKISECRKLPKGLLGDRCRGEKEGSPHVLRRHLCRRAPGVMWNLLSVLTVDLGYEQDSHLLFALGGVGS